MAGAGPCEGETPSGVRVESIREVVSSPALAGGAVANDGDWRMSIGADSERGSGGTDACWSSGERWKIMTARPATSTMAAASTGSFTGHGTKSPRARRAYQGTGPGAHHAVDEAGGSVRGLDRLHERHRALEPDPLALALRARRQMRVQLRLLGGAQRVVGASGEEVARVLAGHGRKRSSFALSSMRARCRRERTVPSSRPSASEISS